VNPIGKESIENPRFWAFCKPAGVGVLWCPRTRFLGIFNQQSEQWTIHGPHATFDHAVSWLRRAAPELPINDQFVELWRANIERPDDGAMH
jgi:hypothetical protein